MDNVFASLNKKDSLQVLMENYEESLHKAEHISESPRNNDVADLIKKKLIVTRDNAEEDSYSKIVKEKEGYKDADMGLSGSNNQEKTIDRKILAMTTKIRNQQNWVSQAENKDIDDFDGDAKAMLEHKIFNGVRTLTQDEKMLMFGLVNNEMNDQMAVLRKMAGVTSQSQKKRNKVGKS